MASANMSSAVGVGIGGAAVSTAALIPGKFRKQLEVAWKKELGHMYGENFQDETHKVIGKPNIPGWGKYETGKKKGQPRKIRFRKTRSSGKGIISRVPDSNEFGFRYMHGARLPIWDVQSNFTVEFGFDGGGTSENPTVFQESGFTSVMHILTKGDLPKYYNRRNVSVQKREAFKKEWQSMDKKYVSFYMSLGFKDLMVKKWGYSYKPSIKRTYHPTLDIALSRQQRKFARTLSKYITKNLARISKVSVQKV